MFAFCLGPYLPNTDDCISRWTSVDAGYTPEGKLWALNEGGAPFQFALDEASIWKLSLQTCLFDMRPVFREVLASTPWEEPLRNPFLWLGFVIDSLLLYGAKLDLQ